MTSNRVVPAAQLAHQGGWDEILLIGAPIAIIIVIFAIAKKKVDQINDGEHTNNAPHDDG